MSMHTDHLIRAAEALATLQLGPRDNLGITFATHGYKASINTHDDESLDDDNRRVLDMLASFEGATWHSASEHRNGMSGDFDTVTGRIRVGGRHLELVVFGPKGLAVAAYAEGLIETIHYREPEEAVDA